MMKPPLLYEVLTDETWEEHKAQLNMSYKWNEFQYISNIKWTPIVMISRS